MSQPAAHEREFRMLPTHRRFTAVLLALIACLLLFPALVLVAFVPALPRWLILVAALGVLAVCECYARQMFAVFTVNEQGLTYLPQGGFMRFSERPRVFPWKAYTFTVYRTQPKRSEVKLWRGIWLPVYMTNPGVPMRTMQFYTDSFLGMYAVIGVRRRPALLTHADSPAVDTPTAKKHLLSRMSMYVKRAGRRGTEDRETWLGVPQCVEDADMLLRTVVANSGAHRS